MNKKELIQEKLKRPWQATIWIYFRTIKLLLLSGILFAVSFALYFEGHFILYVKERYFNEISFGYVYLIIVIAVLFVILNLILIKGFFRGWKWAVVTSMFFEFLELAINLVLLFFKEEKDFISLGYSIFTIYLIAFCLNHPFYNQKKVEQKS